MNIVVKKSEGSLDNIERMQSRENAAFGIVQSDVLGVLYLKKPEVAKKSAMIYPFYSEEVHIIARKNIKSFTDLTQKTIATGTKGSGNWLTMVYLFHKMHISSGFCLWLVGRDREKSDFPAYQRSFGAEKAGGQEIRKTQRQFG